jgi:adenylosuccinate lyase
MKDAATALRVPDPGIRALFSQEGRWQAWLDVEVALARAEAELGMIPPAAADVIASVARLECLDRGRIVEGLARTGHPLVPVVWELARVCPGDAGHYVHWGATTQNIVDTAEMLLMRRANRVFLGLLADVLEALAALAERTADRPAPGRTHGQHAVPITFGLKVAGWIDELARAAGRLEAAEDQGLFVAMAGGAAGTFASFGAQGVEVQARMGAHLGLPPMSVPSRAIQDRFADHCCRLALLAATCGRVGGEVYTLMKQEFGEAREPVPEGTVGSSTMPQKRNPILAQDLIAGAAEVRAALPLALEAMQIEHEANRANTQMMRRAAHGICETVGDMLARLLVVARGLEVDPARMRRNLDLTGGLILAEVLMLELGRRIGRQAAHDVIYAITEQVMADGGDFADRLAQDPVVTTHLAPEELAGLLDPAAYTGLSRDMAQRQAVVARDTAARLRAGAPARPPA